MVVVHGQGAKGQALRSHHARASCIRAQPGRAEGSLPSAICDGLTPRSKQVANTCLTMTDGACQSTLQH